MNSPSPTRCARVLSPRGEVLRRSRRILLPHGEKVVAKRPDEGAVASRSNLP